MRIIMQQKLHDQLLRYGKIVKDIEYDKNGGCHRIRIISYLGFVYYDHMYNGNMVECTLLGKE